MGRLNKACRSVTALKEMKLIPAFENCFFFQQIQIVSLNEQNAILVYHFTKFRDDVPQSILWFLIAVSGGNKAILIVAISQQETIIPIGAIVIKAARRQPLFTFFTLKETNVRGACKLANGSTYQVFSVFFFVTISHLYTF